LNDLTGNLPENGCNLSFQLTYSCFPCVSSDNHLKTRVSDRNLLFRNVMGTSLFRNKVILGNTELLIFGISREMNNLQSVTQSFRNRIQNVGCRDEKYVRKIKRYLKIMIRERVILFGIKCLKKCCRRVTPVITTDLIDF